MDNQGITIYDNEGRSWDRYTVIFDGSVYGMSSNATSPDGFNQYNCEESALPSDRSHLGEIVNYDDVPEEVQKAIQSRVADLGAENYNL